MNKKQRYCFLAFGELALDVTYDEKGIINQSGGVSAFNTLYNLSVFGEETYAIGGVGIGPNGIKAVNSLRKSGVNTENIETIEKTTNVFYIFKPQKELKNDNEIKIGRESPNTGESSIEWTDKISTDFPQEFEDRNVILIVSNFEPVTKEFIKKAKQKCINCKVSLDITNGKIFERYSKEYILEYFQSIDFIQCNENTLEFVLNKLNMSSPEELFAKVKAQIFTLTRGSKGATFLYRSDGKEKIINKIPPKIAPLIDTTGAGDAFHALMLMSYCRMKYNEEELNDEYFERAFNIANAFSRKIVQTIGARDEPYDILKYMINYMKQNTDEYEGHSTNEERM